MTEQKPKRKMRPGGGKAKGSSFEAKVAKALSAALPINFIKSPGSGARIGGKNFATIGAMMGEETMKLFMPMSSQLMSRRWGNNSDSLLNVNLTQRLTISLRWFLVRQTYSSGSANQWLTQQRLGETLF